MHRPSPPGAAARGRSTRTGQSGRSGLAVNERRTCGRRKRRHRQQVVSHGPRRLLVILFFALFYGVFAVSDGTSQYLGRLEPARTLRQKTPSLRNSRTPANLRCARQAAPVTGRSAVVRRRTTRTGRRRGLLRGRRARTTGGVRRWNLAFAIPPKASWKETGSIYPQFFYRVALP